MTALFAAVLIALSANAVNLLDLRPGRAGAVFLIAALPLLFLVLHTGNLPLGIPPLLFVALPALRLWHGDATAHLMLGDTGSNVLGACLGLQAAEIGFTPFWVVPLVLLAAFHLFAERRSLTETIERVPLLRALDRLTGVR